MTSSGGEQGDFLVEAQLALDDLGDGLVLHKQMSKTLNNPTDTSIAYINIKSKGNHEFCIELTQSGYRIVGQQYDDKSQTTTATKYYESLQALLTNKSKTYVDSFAQSLQEKLLATQQQLEQDNDEDSS